MANGEAREVAIQKYGVPTRAADEGGSDGEAIEV